ncbi:DUF3147 family protein [Flagellatimonas centrodinii]|uniref:DUF3147 family protein n=1 Tax=Flagellatimonas centrodinii TaxID=2806210 RepID=UPI001FEE940E|nr:DUF3147 family protein [Flagellatimonas centrodinii]ULQ46650.1 DUF3147 family protein [Flagellatimonas centrodinii]
MYLLLKFSLSAAVVVAVSELARRSTLAGALLASLPLTTLLALIWLYVDTQDTARVAALSVDVLWMVIPSLALLALLPVLLRHGLGFWPALGLSSLATAALYVVMIAVLRHFGRVF